MSDEPYLKIHTDAWLTHDAVLENIQQAVWSEFKRQSSARSVATERQLEDLLENEGTLKGHIVVSCRDCHAEWVAMQAESYPHDCRPYRVSGPTI